VTELRTERLIMRQWRPSDRVPFAQLNADPRVMEFFPAVLTPAQSDETIARVEKHWRQHGFGVYAVECIADRRFAGFIGLIVPAFEAPFTPCVEIGWRLAVDFWGQGFATEGARAVVQHAFDGLGLDSLVSMTVPANLRSRRVMEKLGMTRDPADDFDHPKLPQGHPLRRHVLYRLRKELAIKSPLAPASEGS
jgi:RimJ/RimL family protein N-acetyltransferase